jgi:predicted DNA-binding transcriptional regulator AlpA
MTIPKDLPADAILLNESEVAVALRCSPRHLRNLMNAGRIPRPAVQQKKFTRWTRAQLEAWAVSLTPAPAVA